MKEIKVMISAGEKSGEFYGAKIIKGLKNIDPSFNFFGIAGDQMIQLGFNPIYHIKDIAHTGFIERIKHRSFLSKVVEDMKEVVIAKTPALVVLIDAPFINLKMAEAIKKNAPNVKILYYIPPAVWLSRKKRIKIIRKYADFVINILPFEKEFYKAHGVNTYFWGFPLHEELKNYPKDIVKFRQALNIGNEKNIITLTVGSRRQTFNHLHKEINKLIPAINKISPNCVFVVPLSKNTIQSPLLNKWETDLQKNYPNVKIIGDAKYALAHSDLALCNVGTVHTEATLLGCPNIVYANFSRLDVILIKLLATKFVTNEKTNKKELTLAMGNILLKKAAFPEFLFDRCKAELILSEIQRFLANPQSYKKQQQSFIKEVQTLLTHEKNHFQEVTNFIYNQICLAR